jgi:hypothetical protein
MVRVFRDAFHRADLDALRCIEMPDALGAFHGINLVKFYALVYGLVGALRLTNIAIDALFGDLERQRPTPVP